MIRGPEMNDQRKEILKALMEKLSEANPAEAVALLQKIESIGKDIPHTAEKLIPFLSHQDYLVRSRVFIALSRINDAAVSDLLLDYLETGPGEEWQLRVLECLYHFYDRRVVSKVSSLLNQHTSPLL
jgi:HEAT repeat protein